MKIRFKNILIALFCSAALLFSGIAPRTTLTVRAAPLLSEEWFDEMIQSFKDWQDNNNAAAAGAVASAINGDNFLLGAEIGYLLNKDVNYYHQPTKIFDKVNSAYKDTSSSTSLPNCQYSYEGGDDFSTTNNYRVFQDNSDYSTNTYNYQWYNPITQNYNYTDNFYYNYDYDTFYYQTTTNNYQYDYYYIDNSTHVTYYIVETDTETGEENDYQYDIYYELPDGRNSYNLEKEDVWGTYFIYDVVNYKSVAEDDGTTLGLWHFDGNTNDSSYWNNDAGISSAIQYSTGVFDSGKYMPEDTSVTLELPLGNSSFDSSEPFTLEWIEYHPGYSVSGYNYFEAHRCFLMPSDMMYDNVIQFNTWVYYALVFDGTEYSLFVNGVEAVLSANTPTYHGSSSLYCGFDIKDSGIVIYPYQFVLKSGTSLYHGVRYHYGSTIDEMRLSKGVLYDSNYVPSAEPFTTNNVLVLPDNIKDSDILLYSNYETTDFRIGGVRQTYPTNGSVFIVLDDNDIVTSVQQYQVNQWVEVEARVYVNGETQTLKGYDMASFKLAAPSVPDDDSDSSVSSGNGASDSDDGSGEGVTAIIDAIGDVFDTVLKIIGNFISMFTEMIDSVLDMLSLFTNFSDGFSNFLGATFSFIPSEVWTVIGSGITLMILAGLIKMWKG